MGEPDGEFAAVRSALADLLPRVPASWRVTVERAALADLQVWRVTVVMGCAASLHGRAGSIHQLVVDWQHHPAQDLSEQASQVITQALTAANRLPDRLHAAAARWN